MRLQIADCRLQHCCGPEPVGPAQRHLPPGRSSDARTQRGQSLVELALLLPLFLVVILGIIETGRLWWTQQALTNAAREGLRIATQHATKDCPPTRQSGTYFIQDEVRKQLNAAGLVVGQSSNGQLIDEVTAERVDDVTRRVRIRITYRFNSLLPFLPGLISGSTVIGNDTFLVTEAVAECEP
ncbi:MAG TPA: TadE/TadG family type IV pilus assembly protein [Blastocatellia bacterium]|nr:TadE/TadG family type IV pilus assembly protein [Blastocatellia bacterium]